MVIIVQEFTILCTAVHVIIYFSASFLLIVFIWFLVSPRWMDAMTWMEKAKEGKNENNKRELHELPYTEMIKSDDNSCLKEEVFLLFPADWKQFSVTFQES